MISWISYTGLEGVTTESFWRRKSIRIHSWTSRSPKTRHDIFLNLYCVHSPWEQRYGRALRFSSRVYKVRSRHPLQTVDRDQPTSSHSDFQPRGRIKHGPGVRGGIHEVVVEIEETFVYLYHLIQQQAFYTSSQSRRKIFFPGFLFNFAPARFSSQSSFPVPRFPDRSIHLHISETLSV